MVWIYFKINLASCYNKYVELLDASDMVCFELEILIIIYREVYSFFVHFNFVDLV